MRKTVLVHGCDPALLQTRQLLLNRIGVEVETVLGDAQPLDRVLGGKPIDLLILCSSLDTETRQQDLTLVHAAKPDLNCLVVADATGFQSAEREVVVRGLDGPERFLQAVQNLIC